MTDKRTFYMRSEQARESAIALIRNLPLHEKKPMMVVVEPFKAPRKLDQNALMWSGPLKDISGQAYVDGKRFTAETWHEMFKEEFLPDEFDSDLCLKGYVKYAYDAKGSQRLVGSTTQLTVRGFALYLQQVEAFGANLGVQFSERPA